MTLVEFLLERIAEDEAHAREAMGATDGEWSSWNRSWDAGARDLAAGGERIAALPTTIDEHVCRHDPARVLAECEAKRRIVGLHKSWPVMVETPPTFETAGSDLDINSMTFRMSQQFAWVTQQEYRERFGDEPPTAPILAAMAEVYADHPDYDEEWRL